MSRLLRPLREFGFGRNTVWEGGVGLFVFAGIGESWRMQGKHSSLSTAVMHCEPQCIVSMCKADNPALRACECRLCLCVDHLGAHWAARQARQGL